VHDLLPIVEAIAVLALVFGPVVWIDRSKARRSVAAEERTKGRAKGRESPAPPEAGRSETIDRAPA
jgi:hypothetical protein